MASQTKERGNLFSNPVVGDKVILTDRFGGESIRHICEVTSKTIRVVGCNLYRFKRDGAMHKGSDYYGTIGLTIRPFVEIDG